MKIDGLKPGLSRTSKTKGGSKAQKSARSKAKGTSQPQISRMDSVDVSNHEETLEVIKGLVAESPDIRMEEVDRIVSLLRNGKYKIDFERVAEGFIKEAILNEMAKKSGKKL